MRFERWWLVVVFALVLWGCTDDERAKMNWKVESPTGDTSIELTIENGAALYSVKSEGIVVIDRSRLGLVTDAGDYSKDVSFVGASELIRVEDAFELPHGKQRSSSAVGTELVVDLATAGGPMAVWLRAYDDGVAFRYGLEVAPETRIIDEVTAFSISGTGRAFMQPHQHPTQHAPAYERPYSEVPVGHGAPVAGWVFPALFDVDNRWMLLTEADVDDTYWASHLEPTPEGTTYVIDQPDPREGLGVGDGAAVVSGEWTSPWRVVIVGPEPATVFESSLVRHLSRPAVGDFSWVEPGRVSWSWWSDHDSPQNRDALRDHVDVASEFGWEYSLIDANWNLMPAGTIEDLVAYGAERNVGLFLWYNSGGPHNDVTEQPRDRMHQRDVRRAEFEWLSAVGVKGVKVDFFHRDKQAGIGLYLDIVRDAADFEIMVNFHGSTIPRGWDRRFPHMMTMEGVWGAEQYGFDATFSELAPSHNTMLAMTRNVPGSMDYTPVTFSDTVFPHMTTNAHELALSVVFESSLQHFADAAASYRAQPDAVRSFLSAVPSVWDESRLLAGEPGDFLVVARRLGDAWFVGGINGTGEERVVEVPSEFRADDSTLIADGTDGRSFSIRTIGGNEPVMVTMAPHGGFVVSATLAR